MKTTVRAGMTIDQSGRQAALPLWKHADASPTSWVGRLGHVRLAVLSIAQKRHEQNQAVILARAAGKQPALPEADVRQSLARKQQRDLAELNQQIDRIAVEANAARLKLIEAVRDFASKGSFSATLLRGELRNLLRTMTPDQRRDALRQREFAEAALEGVPQLSGLSLSEHSAMIEAELRNKYPDEVAGADEALEAVGLTREIAKVARLAVEAELLASGATIVEPASPTEPATWT